MARMCLADLTTSVRGKEALSELRGRKQDILIDLKTCEMANVGSVP